LTAALDGGEWSASRPVRFIPPEERVAGTNWIGGWEGSRAGLDTVLKRKFSSPRRDSNPAHSQSLYRLSYPALISQVRNRFWWKYALAV